MASQIIAEYEYFIFNPFNGVCHNVKAYKGLADCVQGFNDNTKPDKKLDYYKVYRAVRKFGFACEPFLKVIDLDGPIPCNMVVVIRMAGAQEVLPGFAHLQSQAVTPPALTPLEKLIAEAPFTEQEPKQYEETASYTVWYHKRNQITGKPNRTWHSVDIDAESESLAQRSAATLLDTGQKHKVVIIAAERQV